MATTKLDPKSSQTPSRQTALLKQRPSLGRAADLATGWLALGLDVPILAAAAQILITAVALGVFHHLVPQGPFPLSSAGYAAWDGVHYTSIAQHGYRVDAETAFFPLYPLLAHAVHTVTRLSYVHSGMLVSDVCAAVAFVLLHRLVARGWDRNVADRSVVLLMAFPFALFLNVVYTEALSLMLVVLFFFLLQRDLWWWAILAGAFAGASHDLGVLLALPALWYWWNHGRSPVRLVSVAFIGAGLAAYAGFLFVAFHNPFEFAVAQHYWGRESVVPVWSLIQALAQVNLHAAGVAAWNLNFASLLNTTATLAVVALTCWALVVRALPGEQMVYLATTLLASISTGTTRGAPAAFWSASYGRSMLVLFPAFIALGLLLRRRSVVLAVVAVMLSLRVLLTGMFGDGYWVV